MFPLKKLAHKELTKVKGAIRCQAASMDRGITNHFDVACVACLEKRFNYCNMAEQKQATSKKQKIRSASWSSDQFANHIYLSKSIYIWT